MRNSHLVSAGLTFLAFFYVFLSVCLLVSPLALLVYFLERM